MCVGQFDSEEPQNQEKVKIQRKMVFWPKGSNSHIRVRTLRGWTQKQAFTGLRVRTLIIRGKQSSNPKKKKISGFAVRIRFGILAITFYSDIGLS